MEKIFFASDFHLGLDAVKTSREREKQVIRWLESIRGEATRLFLVGDLFDFWYEYQAVVPRGFTRLLGKLAELSDQGLQIEIFSGNHDMWLRSYLEEELNVAIHHHPIRIDLLGKQFLIGHGDGLGPGDSGYKMIKRIFRSPLSQWLFSRLHPNFAFRFARFWSRKSRDAASHEDRFRGKENEWLVSYCEEQLAAGGIDYFVFGHRHLPINCLLSDGQSRYINLGDWLQFNSYASYDGQQMQLHFFENPDASALML